MKVFSQSFVKGIEELRGKADINYQDARFFFDIGIMLIYNVCRRSLSFADIRTALYKYCECNYCYMQIVCLFAICSMILWRWSIPRVMRASLILETFYDVSFIPKTIIFLH